MSWKVIKKELPDNQRMVFVCAAAIDLDDCPDYFAAVVYQDGKFGNSQMEYTHWMYPPVLKVKTRKSAFTLNTGEEHDTDTADTEIP
jgi:hypothetical protein